jgi:branched-chain amino acid transport system permease protein
MSGRWLAVVAILLVLPHIPGLTSDFGRSLLSQMGIAAVFALSFNILLGQTGLLSFGHAVFFGLGAYAAIHLMKTINGGLALPIAIVPAVGALAGLAFGVLLGLVTTRRAGTIFALITLGIGELVYAATFMLPGYFGGEEGITASRTRGPSILGVDLVSQLQVYYVIAAWGLVAAVAMRAFIRTPVGRMCNAVRDNPQRVAFVGYDPRIVRLIAFSAAGMFAGLAGGLHAINYEIVSADSVSALRSGNVLVMAYIGGAGHFGGPVIGAVLLTWLQASLSGYTSAWLLYLGVFFMITIVFAPDGLAGLLALHAPILHTRALRRVLGSYCVVALPCAVMLGGVVFIVEMSYRLSTQPELGTRMRVLYVPLDAATSWPWIGAVAAIVIGFLLLRRTRRIVADAWSEAHRQAAAARLAGTQP